MKDENKTKNRLIRELKELKQVASELKAYKLEHEKAQTALGESENRYKSLVDLSPEAVFVHQEGNILYVNSAGINIFGAGNSEELLHKPLLDLVHPDYHDAVKIRLNEIYMSQKTLDRANLKLIRLDNKVIDVEATGTYIKYSGKPAGLSVVRDVTERKLSEIALKISETRYRQLVETMNEGLGLSDQNYKFTYVNPRFCEMLGYHRSDIVGCRVMDFVHDDYKKIMKDQIARRKKGEEERFELAWKTKSGNTIYTNASPKALFDDDGNFIGSMGILTDITYRKKAEEALRLSEEKYRHVVENANDAIFVLQDGKIKFFNNKARLIGRELGIDLDRNPFDRYIHLKDREMVIDRLIRRLAGENLPDTYAFRLIGKDDQVMWVEVNPVKLSWEGKPATLNFLRDITFQRTLEQQLQLAQKMEAVGTLAGGIAHDFNNLLMGIQGRASLMMIETDRFHPSFEHLQEIENIVQKATKLTKQLLGFARGGKYEVEPTDLNELVENSAQLFGRTKKEISIFQKYDEKLWPARVDKSQIDQVLLNIFVNAWQAMPDGGDLYIQTNNEILDESFAQAHGLTPGKFIKISIADTGIGMDDQTIKRVFDPFFTTKEKERGTGLGLASAYGIIKNHDGTITVDSKKGDGATFSIYLPASEKAAFKEQIYEQKISTGTETVLLVDDEAMIIDIGFQLLDKMGYKVLTAHSGKEAIQIYKQNATRVAMVILDLIMPGMGGGEVYDRLKEVDSNVKVLLSSGYSIDGQAAEILNRGCDGFIQKPFRLNELSKKLREIIAK
jgi:PAS domain S-box-containing protein